MRYDENQYLWDFLIVCMKKNIIYSDRDFYNFSKACNIKVDMKHALDNFFIPIGTKIVDGNTTTFEVTKSLLGPCYVHPQGTNPKSIKYNISNIIQELKLSQQNISPREKLKKITDYIELLG
jgi:hypothetical protein